MTIAVDVSLAGSIGSYSDLKQAILDETDGRASDTRLDWFIRSTESAINAVFAVNPVRPMMTRASISIDGEYIASPSDMIRPYGVEVLEDDKTREVVFVDSENITALQPITWPTDYPDRFAMVGNELRFWPIPTQTYTGTILYYQRLPALSADNQSNWLLEQFPNAYLEGGLFYAYRDMPDLDKATALKQLFDETMNAVLAAYPKPANRSRLRVDCALAPQWNQNGGYNPGWRW